MYFFFGQTETLHERTLGYFFSSKLSIQLYSEDTILKLLPIKKKKVTRNCFNIGRQTGLNIPQHN